jgi:hypothetical protein
MTPPICHFCQATLRLSTSTSVANDWQCQSCPYYPIFCYRNWPIPDFLYKYTLHFKVKETFIRWIFYQVPKDNVWSEIIDIKKSGLRADVALVKFNRPLNIPIEKMEERLLTYLTFL